MNSHYYAQAGFIVARYPSPGKMVIEDTTHLGSLNVSTENIAQQATWTEPAQEIEKPVKVTKNFKTGAGLDRQARQEPEVIIASYTPKETTSTKLEPGKMTLIKKPTDEKKNSSIEDEDQLFKKAMAY